jgi:hypothetical protein
MKKEQQIEAQNALKAHFLQFEQAKEEIYNNLSIISFVKPINNVVRPCMVVFKGTARKPIENYYYLTEERRQEAIQRVKSDEDLYGRKKRERNELHKNFEHSLKVGDILYSSWGYEQTNVDFYEVIKVKGKCVIIRELAQSLIPDGDMSGKTTALKGEYTGEPVLKRVCYGNVIKFNSYQWAKVWEASLNTFLHTHNF